MSCQEKKYPVGIQTFSEIREGGYVYVDKTAYVHTLVSGGKYYFLSRPRRFGKSLLMSTIEAYFQGRRELFKGLAIDKLTDEWDEYPVLHLDLNADKFENKEALETYLDLKLKEWEKKYEVEVDPTAPVSYRFGSVIEKAHEAIGRQVVILVDEYDKPMLNVIDNEELLESHRGTLKAFYGNLKSKDSHIKFAMLTGVARFSMVSVFSDLNNLNDISFVPMFSGICGITNEELDQYFRDGIECMGRQLDKTAEEIRQELKNRYDGYHFSENLMDIYNPFSIMNAFRNNYFDNYWANSGTPAYLVKMIRKRHARLADMEGKKINAKALGSEIMPSIDPIPSLFQSGYLTIKHYNPQFRTYTLGYPNGEVAESFIDFLAPLYLGRENMDSEFDIEKFVEEVQNGEVETFMTRIDSLLRGVPHIDSREPHEVFFQNVTYVIFKLMSFYVKMEDHTSNGRIDLTVETERYAYVFEFKINKSAAEAMAQIEEKKYWKKFEASGKQIILVAANFNTAERALDDVIVRQEE